MKTPQPKFTITYNGTNITADVSKYYISCTYTDKVEGESDEIAIELDDTDGLWRGSWYPDKGATLTLEIEFNGQKLKAGTFQVDEIEQSGPPHTVNIKALAAGIQKALRTKTSKAYDKTTLRGLAQFIASKYGMTVEGEIEAINIERVTQHREKDLAFLRKVGLEYGYIFSVRDKKLIFTTQEKLEKGSEVTTIDLTELISYSLRDKAVEVYKDATVKYKDPKTNTVVQGKVGVDEIANKDGVGFNYITSGDTAASHVRAENAQQAKAKARALLYRKNTKQNEGRIELPGNPLLVAGINFMLTGLGVLSGKYHVTQSTHRITKDGGYITELEVKRVGGAKDKAQQKPKKIARKPATPQLSASAATTTQITNADGKSFTVINSN